MRQEELNTYKINGYENRKIVCTNQNATQERTLVAGCAFAAPALCMLAASGCQDYSPRSPRIFSSWVVHKVFPHSKF